MKLKIACYVVAMMTQVLHAKIWLVANDDSDPYALINSTFEGNALELPDCIHQSFGPHITQQTDSELNRTVFAFHIHINSDNDRCERDDRQRVEIKPPTEAPDILKGFENEIVSLSWNFRLDNHFQVTPNFCSLHQIKLKGGNDALPMITLNARSRGRETFLEVIYNEVDVNRMVLKSENLAKFLGRWIHAREELSYGRTGKYYLELSRLDSDEVILSVTKKEVNLWRDGAEYARPKWGIYRSLATIDGLRDEKVYFDSFCLGKGTIDKCP